MSERLTRLSEKRRKALEAVTRTTQETIARFPLILADLEDEERRLRDEVRRTQSAMEETLQEKDSEIEETRKLLKQTQAQLNEKRNGRLDLDIALGEIIKKIRQSGSSNLNLLTGFTTEELCAAVDQWCAEFERDIASREQLHAETVSGMRTAISKEASDAIILEYEQKQLQILQSRNFQQLDLDRSILFPVIKAQQRLVSRYDIVTASYPTPQAKKALPPVVRTKDQQLKQCYSATHHRPLYSCVWNENDSVSQSWTKRLSTALPCDSEFLDFL